MNILSTLIIFIISLYLNFLFYNANSDSIHILVCDEHLIQQNALMFFNACEAGKGWDATQMYVLSEESTFNAQVTDSLPGPKLSKVKTVKDYTTWMVGVVEEFGPKATAEIKTSAVDKERHTAIFYAIFAGVSDYVYSLSFDVETCKINSMHKIWNDGYAAEHPPTN